MKGAKPAAGFTLVEVLVVLVITALVSTLLFQALAQVYRLQERFGVQLSQSRSGVMRADWYRQIIQGLQTDYEDAPRRFSGQSNQLTGLTSTPLATSRGGSQWVTLELAEGQLRYRAGDQRATLMTWAGSGAAEFAYVDEAGLEHTQWPPSLGKPVSQLPAAVLLKVPQLTGRLVLAATPVGMREARVRPFVLGGSP